jgi:hypothetical protein
MKMPAYIVGDEIADGYVITVLHPKTGAPMMMFKMSHGSGEVAKRAIKAYHAGDGDADAYFYAEGMSDEEAFSKETWKTR